MQGGFQMDHIGPILPLQHQLFPSPTVLSKMKWGKNASNLTALHTIRLFLFGLKFLPLRSQRGKSRGDHDFR